MLPSPGKVELFLVVLLVIGACTIALLKNRVDTLEDTITTRDSAITKLNDDLARAVKMAKENDKILEEVSNAYQDQINDIDRRLTAAKRVQPSRCIPVYFPAPSDTPRFDGYPESGHVPADAGVSSYFLLDYGAKCEVLRQTLIGVQSFVSKTWALNEQ